MKRKLFLILLIFTYSVSNGQAAIAMNPSSCDGDLGIVQVENCCYESYQWFYSSSSSENFQPISNATESTFIYDWITYNHNYIKVFVVNGTIYYFSNTIYLNKDDCNLSIIENISTDLTITPNPVEDVFTLAGYEKFDHIQIYNSLGKQVFDCSKPTTIIQIDMSSFSDGIYFLIAKSEEKIQKIKFVKR